MSEPKQTSKQQVEVLVSVSSTSELHSLKAGMTVARALYHAGIPYIVAEHNIPDGETISRAEMISQSEILYRVKSCDNISK